MILCFVFFFLSPADDSGLHTWETNIRWCLHPSHTADYLPVPEGRCLAINFACVVQCCGSIKLLQYFEENLVWCKSPLKMLLVSEKSQLIIFFAVISSLSLRCFFSPLKYLAYSCWVYVLRIWKPWLWQAELPWKVKNTSPHQIARKTKQRHKPISCSMESIPIMSVQCYSHVPILEVCAVLKDQE